MRLRLVLALAAVAVAAVAAQEAEVAVVEQVVGGGEEVVAVAANPPVAVDGGPDVAVAAVAPKAVNSAFVGSLFMIIASEIGDKTFFIAAIMAMRHSRGIVFAGAIGALGLMTVLSAAMGHAVPQLLPKVYTHYAAMCLFFFFGVRLLKEAWEMEPDEENEELEEVLEELGEKKKSMAQNERDIESGEAANKGVLGGLQDSVFWQAFSLTFLAEWGDRSQIATIAMAAAKDPIGVSIGGTLGHALCTAVAVIGGRMLAARISVRTVSLAGGILFLIFGAVSLYEGPDSLI